MRMLNNKKAQFWPFWRSMRYSFCSRDVNTTPWLVVTWQQCT